jgi:hypothetical protein
MRKIPENVAGMSEKKSWSSIESDEDIDEEDKSEPAQRGRERFKVIPDVMITEVEIMTLIRNKMRAIGEYRERQKQETDPRANCP